MNVGQLKQILNDIEDDRVIKLNVDCDISDVYISDIIYGNCDKRIFNITFINLSYNIINFFNNCLSKKIICSSTLFLNMLEDGKLQQIIDCEESKNLDNINDDIRKDLVDKLSNDEFENLIDKFNNKIVENNYFIDNKLKIYLNYKIRS